jgi:SAM-dependent MidA family methyltransferase
LTPAGRIIADEIDRSGPIAFSRFMEIALYHPEHGYYVKDRDPFGKTGDFYTAEQLQPVFGRLVRQMIIDLASASEDLAVVEMGAGRKEMADAFAGFRYTPVDIAFGSLPDSFSGVVFSNEFFDAIPVDVFVGNEERRVSFDGNRFTWTIPVDGPVRESQGLRLEWLERIASRLQEGFIVTIDYGFTHRELPRFPEGTLMSYRRHQAIEDVLDCPGEQDITAHVDFTALREHGEKVGLETVRYEKLAMTLLRTGEADQFASALAAGTEDEAFRLRMQLKSLLFGMGETFQVLVQRKSTKEKRPLL